MIFVTTIFNYWKHLLLEYSFCLKFSMIIGFFSLDKSNLAISSQQFIKALSMGVLASLKWHIDNESDVQMSTRNEFTRYAFKCNSFHNHL